MRMAHVPVTHACTQCSLSFKDAWHLKRHMFTHGIADQAPEVARRRHHPRRHWVSRRARSSPSRPQTRQRTAEGLHYGQTAPEDRRPRVE